MAWIGIRACLTKILAAPSSASAASKSLLQINLNRLLPMQAAFISGSALKDKSKERPAPFPYKTKRYNLWRAWLQDTTTHRFDENTKIIVVEGPIAAGKSAFAKSLAEDLDMLHMPEVTMDALYINDYGYDLRKLDPQLPAPARSYDEKNFCIEPKHENTARFQILKYKLRYSQYIDALAHLMNTGLFIRVCTRTDVQRYCLVPPVESSCYSVDAFMF
jgi:NADH dehydrogenase (ubiquinone) 1 alpha subcomplex subunit 10